jgi:hypothetical protein
MSFPDPPAKPGLDEPPDCCSPDTPTMTEHWSHVWSGPGPDPPSCCDTAYPAAIAIFSDDPTQTIWKGQFIGTDICGNYLVLNYVLTRNKITNICTADRTGAGPSSKTGLYGMYPPLVAAGLCGVVTIVYEVSLPP